MNKIKKAVGMAAAACLTISLLCSSAFAAEPVKPTISSGILTAQETAEIFATQSEITSTAYLPKNNGNGTNGNPAVQFVAEGNTVVFRITNAPGATDYNAQLYAGTPGSGYRVEQYYENVPINNAVACVTLIPGQSYYYVISSNSLITSGCTASYSLSLS